jgi:hypothetical protein
LAAESYASQHGATPRDFGDRGFHDREVFVRGERVQFTRAGTDDDRADIMFHESAEILSKAGEIQSEVLVKRRYGKGDDASQS